MWGTGLVAEAAPPVGICSRCSRNVSRCSSPPDLYTTAHDQWGGSTFVVPNNVHEGALGGMVLSAEMQGLLNPPWGLGYLPRTAAAVWGGLSRALYASLARAPLGGEGTTWGSSLAKLGLEAAHAVAGGVRCRAGHPVCAAVLLVACGLSLGLVPNVRCCTLAAPLGARRLAGMERARTVLCGVQSSGCEYTCT